MYDLMEMKRRRDRFLVERDGIDGQWESIRKQLAFLSAQLEHLREMIKQNAAPETETK